MAEGSASVGCWWGWGAEPTRRRRILAFEQGNKNVQPQHGLGVISGNAAACSTRVHGQGCCECHELQVSDIHRPLGCVH